MASLVISNADAGRLFLHWHGLGTRSNRQLRHEDVLSLVRQLGFVQRELINIVERRIT